MAAKRIKIDNASSKFRRQSQKREQKVIRCSVLIVCEGTKTEPNYFEAFADKQRMTLDRKSTRLNSSHRCIS